MDTSQASAVSTTKVEEFIQDLDAGVFEKLLSSALSEVAAAVVDKGKKGKVTVTFDFQRISDSASVVVAHTLRFERPTTSGVASEKSSRSTPMHVGRGGKLTLAPETQVSFLDRNGKFKHGEQHNG